jgi:hypothetical protein
MIQDVEDRWRKLLIVIFKVLMELEILHNETLEIDKGKFVAHVRLGHECLEIIDQRVSNKLEVTGSDQVCEFQNLSVCCGIIQL